MKQKSVVLFLVALVLATSIAMYPGLAENQTSTDSTVDATQKEFRVGPKVRLRPVNDIIAPNEDGIVELYMSNPELNDVTLTTEVWVDIPTGMHVTGEGFAVDAAAGTAHALFTVPPGNSKTIHVNVKPVKSYEDRTITVHASGYYWPEGDKDNSNPISITHPFKIQTDPVKTPRTKETPKPTPGFEGIFAIASIAMILYLLGRKNK